MDKQKNNDVKISVPWYGYVVFVLAILLFSGIFSSSDGVLRALDFNVLNGSFGSNLSSSPFRTIGSSNCSRNF